MTHGLRPDLFWLLCYLRVAEYIEGRDGLSLFGYGSGHPTGILHSPERDIVLRPLPVIREVL
jgi:hypothetical protein